MAPGSASGFDAVHGSGTLLGAAQVDIFADIPDPDANPNTSTEWITKTLNVVAPADAAGNLWIHLRANGSTYCTICVGWPGLLRQCSFGRGSGAIRSRTRFIDDAGPCRFGDLLHSAPPLAVASVLCVGLYLFNKPHRKIAVRLVFLGRILTVSTNLPNAGPLGVRVSG